MPLFAVFRVDLVIVLAFLLGTFLLGMYLAKSSSDVEGYSVGNRAIPGWIVALSVLGAFLSSITFLGVPSEAYQSQWKGFTFSLALPVSALFATLYFVPLYRQGNRLSAYEFLEERLGRWARIYGAVSFVILQFLRTAMITLLVAFALEPMCDWTTASPATKIYCIIAVMSIVVVIYDMCGGVQAAIWTDILQVSMFVVSAIWIVGLLWHDKGSEFLALGRNSPRFQLGEMAPPADGLWQTFTHVFLADTALVMFLYALTETLRNYGTDQNYVQRILCTKTAWEASASMWFAAIAYLPLAFIFCSIGTLLFLFYQTHPLPADLKPEQVFPYFIHTELPLVVRGITIAGILAAAMSTTDASINATSVVVLVDLVRPWRELLRRPLSRKALTQRTRESSPQQAAASVAVRESGPDETSQQAIDNRRDIWILRGTTLVFGTVSGLLAAWLYYHYGQAESDNLLKQWWRYAGVAGAGLFGLFLVVWLLPRTPSAAVALGIVASIPVMLWGILAAGKPAGVPLALGSAITLQIPHFPLARLLIGISGVLTILGFAMLANLAVRLGLLAPNPLWVAANSRDPQ